jgi:hypothetical protein
MTAINQIIEKAKALETRVAALESKDDAMSEMNETPYPEFVSVNWDIKLTLRRWDKDTIFVRLGVMRNEKWTPEFCIKVDVAQLLMDVYRLCPERATETMRELLALEKERERP